jgi:hypothetical protein
MKTLIHKLKLPQAHHWTNELQALQKSAPVVLSLLFLLACGQALSQLTWLLLPAEVITLCRQHRRASNHNKKFSN